MQFVEVHSVLTRAHEHSADGTAYARVTNAIIALESAADASTSSTSSEASSPAGSGSGSSEVNSSAPSSSSGSGVTSSAAISVEHARSVLSREEHVLVQLVDELDALIPDTTHREVRRDRRAGHAVRSSVPGPCVASKQSFRRCKHVLHPIQAPWLSAAGQRIVHACICSDMQLSMLCRHSMNPGQGQSPLSGIQS